MISSEAIQKRKLLILSINPRVQTLKDMLEIGRQVQNLAQSGFLVADSR